MLFLIIQQIVLEHTENKPALHKTQGRNRVLHSQKQWQTTTQPYLRNRGLAMCQNLVYKNKSLPPKKIFDFSPMMLLKKK